MNIVVTGINVGAQPYWNAEATMLMHTKGILVMTPDSAMVLTGKQSLDYSGGVSAEDNFGIGGYDRIMGPNGQAQYWAPDLSRAVDVLLAHYAHTYRAPGERFPRPAATTDPADRDISSSPHAGPGCDFTRLGEIFDPATNAERKKPFDIRSVLRGVADADHPPLERWADMHDAESVVVLDAHLGGQPVAMIGIESRPLPRTRALAGRRADAVDGRDAVPALVEEDRAGDQRGQRQPPARRARQPVGLRRLPGVVARPAAGVRRGDRPRDGQLRRADRLLRGLAATTAARSSCSPGRSTTTWRSPPSKGSYASVIGGAPAAAVVFAGEVNKRTAADPRVAGARARIAEAADSGDDIEVGPPARRAGHRPAGRALGEARPGRRRVRQPAQHRAGPARGLRARHRARDPVRPYLVDAVRRGMARTLSP